MTGVLKYAERKCVAQIGSLQILTAEKCTVPLKEWMAGSISERVTQTTNDCKFSCKYSKNK